MVSLTEENYLKAIFSLAEQADGDRVSTNAIAARMQTAAASVTDMVKRLHDKELVAYERYKGVSLTDQGEKLAKGLIRKHRLWEVFLMQQLGFAWDEVHDMAEDLEHVDHPALIDRLDDYLGNPEFDPHGDPIPDKEGNIRYHEDINLSKLVSGESGIIVQVSDHSTEFLHFLEKNGLILQTRVKVLEVEDFDGSRLVQVDDKQCTVSEKVARLLVIRRVR